MTPKDKSKLVVKTLAEAWKSMSKKEKEDFALSGSEAARRRNGNDERVENIMNLVEKDNRTQRITKCI